MKSGFLPKSGRQAADDVIAGSDKDPTRLAELGDEDPAEGGEPESRDDQPAMAGA